MQLFSLRVVWRRTSVFILAKGMTIEELREKKIIDTAITNDKFDIKK
jgi:uncharacterized membrane protein YidH (DUF202 family)